VWMAGKLYDPSLTRAVCEHLTGKSIMKRYTNVLSALLTNSIHMAVAVDELTRWTSRTRSTGSATISLTTRRAFTSTQARQTWVSFPSATTCLNSSTSSAQAVRFDERHDCQDQRRYKHKMKRHLLYTHLL